jgi:uncharacterized protein (TIGR04551 family)
VKRAAAATFAAVLASSGAARATGFTDIGNDIRGHGDNTVVVHGALRVRGEIDDNLDLDRGPTPSGQLLFPVPLSNPNGQILATADFRLRADVAVYAPGASVAVKARIDAPDNLVLGGAAEGVPSASSTQGPVAINVQRVYGEALTPIGLLAAGRMGATWGLGILTNGGDCADCDSGDVADRIAFLTPIAGHIFAVAFDFTASGPFVPRKIATRAVDVDPTDDVRSITFAILRWRDDAARERRRLAGKATFEYGAYASHRWQENDVPAAYLPTATPTPLTAQQVVYRGYTATAVDGWARLTTPKFRAELEIAGLFAHVDQGSLIPGVLLNHPVTSKQLGAALETEIGSPTADFRGGFDAGIASGDPAAGFGVVTPVGAKAPKPGDLDGPQANPPGDDTVNNFRFHPDYRVDQILFREIIGTVTDAVYLRPHATYAIAKVGPSRLVAEVAAVASFAVCATSAPGQKSPLGVEVDPTLAWGSADGFNVALEYGALFPLAGLDNPALHLSAQPAQVVRLRLIYAF